MDLILPNRCGALYKALLHRLKKQLPQHTNA